MADEQVQAARDALEQADRAIEAADQVLEDVERRHQQRRGSDCQVVDQERRQGQRRRAEKVACPACGCMLSEVVPHEMTLVEQQTEGYWRRRRCDGCGLVYPTIEAVGDPEAYLAT